MVGKMTKALLERRDKQKLALAAAQALGRSVEEFEMLSEQEQAIALKMVTRSKDTSVTLRLDSGIREDLEKISKNKNQNVSATIRQILYEHTEQMRKAQVVNMEIIHIGDHFLKVGFSNIVGGRENKALRYLKSINNFESHPLSESEISLYVLQRTLLQIEKSILDFMENNPDRIKDITAATARCAEDKKQYPHYKPGLPEYRIDAEQTARLKLQGEAIILALLACAGFIIDYTSQLSLSLCSKSKGAFFPELKGITSENAAHKITLEQLFEAESNRSGNHIKMLNILRNARIHRVHFHMEINRTENCIAFQDSANKHIKQVQYYFTTKDLKVHNEELMRYLHWWGNRIDSYID